MSLPQTIFFQFQIFDTNWPSLLYILVLLPLIRLYLTVLLTWFVCPLVDSACTDHIILPPFWLHLSACTAVDFLFMSPLLAKFVFSPVDYIYLHAFWVWLYLSATMLALFVCTPVDSVCMSPLLTIFVCPPVDPVCVSPLIDYICLPSCWPCLYVPLIEYICLLPCWLCLCVPLIDYLVYSPVDSVCLHPCWLFLSAPLLTFFLPPWGLYFYAHMLTCFVFPYVDLFVYYTPMLTTVCLSAPCWLGCLPHVDYVCLPHVDLFVCHMLTMFVCPHVDSVSLSGMSWSQCLWWLWTRWTLWCSTRTSLSTWSPTSSTGHYYIWKKSKSKMRQWHKFTA